MTLLVNFDSTPQQLCKRAYLTMCRSQYYKHDFAVVSSATTFSTNIVAAEFVKYVDNILCQIFRYKYIYTLFAKSGSKATVQTISTVISYSLKTVYLTKNWRWSSENLCEKI